MKPPILAYLSNTLTNLCMALLTFPLFCFVLYCYAFVQCCNVNTIQYNAMHKFVRVLDNPKKDGDPATRPAKQINKITQLRTKKIAKRFTQADCGNKQSSHTYDQISNM